MFKYRIQTIEVGAGGASNIDFTNIPQIYDDLLIVVSARSTRSGIVSDDHALRFNNSSSGYTNYRLYGYLGSAGSDNTGQTDKAIAGGMSAADSTANTHGNISIYISNYRGSNTKSVGSDGVAENNGGSFQTLTSSVWSGTQAITSITTFPWAGNYTQYSSASLYGIKRGSDGRTEVASGGTITTSGGYTIHTFNSSGTFVANRDMDVEYLVIAGGGAGGANGAGAGGGGAGGYRCSVVGESSGGGASAEAKLRVNSGTSYSVVVGAGGAAITASGYNTTRNNGSSSVFASITALGGGGGSGGQIVGADGGSGGGGNGGYETNGGLGTSNQGYAGGNGDFTSSQYGGGGGGGAGQVGANQSGGFAGKGGDGVASSITGSSVTRAGGGGGGSEINGRSAAGGTGGGGAGSGVATATSGTANTGGGGGGSGGISSSTTSGAGGSGVVIIRYLTPAS